VEKYLEHSSERVGKINMISYRCVKSFPISWLNKLFNAIKVKGDHRLYLGDTGKDIILDTTNYAAVVECLESAR
jgi:hypothetical protein